MIFGGKAQDMIVEACAIDMVIFFGYMLFFDGNIRVQDEAGGAHFLFITAGFYPFVFFLLLLLKH